MRSAAKIFLTLVLAVLGVGSNGANVAAQEPTEQLEVILAIDTSASMESALESAKAAANVFIASMPADVRIGVETFADQAAVLTPPTLDRDLITWQIGSIGAAGDTALYDVVVAASQHFTPTTEHKVIVLLSDGKDEGSTATLDAAVSSVEGVQVEAISLTTAETDLASLQALGPVTSADDAAGVSAAFARISGLIVEVIEPTSPPTTVAPTTTAPPTTVAATTTTPTTVAAAPPIVEVAAPPPSPASSPASTLPLWFGGIATFAGLFLLAFLLFPRQGVSHARLGVDKPKRASELGLRTTTAIEETLERYGKRADLGTTLAVADITMKPAEFVAAVGLVAVVAGLVGLVLAGPVVGVMLTMLVCLGVRFYVRRTKLKRQTAFADQLADVLQLVTTSLRSGYGITQAIESVAEESEEPARSEFAKVLVQTRLGRDLSDALRDLAQRMDSQDLSWVVSAIDINRETGGNLSETMATVGTTIRERSRVDRHVRTLTAEGRLSARILTAFPLVLILWQWRVNPDNFALLTSGIGLIALVVAGILMVIGTLWVRTVVNSVAL